MRGSAESDQPTSLRSKPGFLRPLLFILLAATGLGFFFGAQIYYSAASFRHPVSWAQALYWAFGDWYEWALLSPVIFTLCRRFSFNKQSWPSSLPVHLASGLVLSGFHAVLCAIAAVLQAKVTGPPTTFFESLRGLLAGRMHFNLAVYGMIVCAWHAWDFHRRYREREAQSAALTEQLMRAQLQALRMQLNPHFLFNTLNAISSLMLKDVNKANKMISRLGDLLRLALEAGDRQETPLRDEIDFLRRYVEIEQIRFGDRLAIAMDLQPDTLDAQVPNLILQPLVENAIKHAIEPLPDGGRIQLRSHRNDTNLVVEIIDSGPGLAKTASDGKNTENNCCERIGLGNTRQRLQRLYGEHQSLALKDNPSGGVTASVIIPFRVSNASL